MSGKVYLIGAGPGDPELLTVKARKLIDQSDVILYDSLVGTALIESIPSHIELIHCGKDVYPAEIRQDKINDLMVKQAQHGKTVARLKGGDASLFGRLNDETEVLEAHQIDYEVIPGISAGVAAAASLGIPLTDRDVASGVSFVTGHFAPEKTEETIDWQSLVNSKHTLIFYMGVAHLEYITTQLIGHGMAGSTSVVILEKVSTPEQRNTFGILENISVLAEENNIKAPAIVIIGEVASKLEHHG